jgi:serine/threonine protein kinase
MHQMPKPGSLLDRFKLEREIGQGSLGAVFLAHDTLLDTRVALKIISPALAKTDAFSRLAREVLLARRISHPGICRIYDIHEVSSFLFISMEYIEGPTLEQLIRRNGTLPVERAARLIAYAARALAAAHGQGIVHRGLTPNNLVVRPGDRVSIMDFGQSLARDMAGSTGAAMPEQTVHSMSPEVLAGREATPASDIYSLGAILYRCVTGAQPFPGDNVVELTNAVLEGNMVAPHLFNPQVGQALENLIVKAMAVQPEARYRSVMELKDWLTAVTGEDAESDEPPADDATAAMGLPAGFEPQLEADDLDDPDGGHTQQVLMQETTLLFSDIVAITRYFDKFGDMAGRKRIEKHNKLLFPVIQRHRGRVLKTIGDAIMAYFLLPDDGIEAAIDMQQALEQQNQATQDEDARIFIRIGLHTGPCIIEDQDVFGDAVNVASRVSSQAGGGEILISEITRAQLTRNKDNTEFAAGAILKGKSEHFNLFRIQWQGIALPAGPPQPPPDWQRPLPVAPAGAKTGSRPQAGSAFAQPPPDLSQSAEQASGPRELVPEPLPPARDDGPPEPLYIPENEETGESTEAVVDDGFGLLDAVSAPQPPPPPLPEGTALLPDRRGPAPDEAPTAARAAGGGSSWLLKLIAGLGVLALLGLGVVIGVLLATDDGGTAEPDPDPLPPNERVVSKDDLAAAARRDRQRDSASGAPEGGQGERPEPAPPADSAAGQNDQAAGQTDRAAGGQRDAASAGEPELVAPNKGDATRQRAAEARETQRQWRQLRAAMRAKGLIPGDAPALDRQLRRIRALRRRGRHTAAQGAMQRAEKQLAELAIDRSFVRAKLARFNRAFDRAGDRAAAAGAMDLAEDIMAALESGDHARANALLNRSFRTLRQAGR